jgi:hypothetical protein
MALRIWLVLFGLALVSAGGAVADDSVTSTNTDKATLATQSSETSPAVASENADATATEAEVDAVADEAPVEADDAAVVVADQKYELFDAIDAKVVDVKLIVKNDHESRLIIRNVSERNVDVRLPEAFAGVPLAQFGGGGGGGNRGGGGGGLGGGGGGGQSVGGGGGGGLGGGGGGGFGGGGGGFFSIPPEKTSKINLPVVCLDHGKKDPSSSMPYVLVPAEQHIDKPEVIVLLKAFGRGELHHHSVQAAVWNLNNGITWQQLAAKLQGTVRSFNRPPYFTPDELKAAYAYAAEAVHRAESESESESKYDEGGATGETYEPYQGPDEF